MDYTVTTNEYKKFAEGLPRYEYPLKLKKLRPFLQKLTEKIVQKMYPDQSVEWFSMNIAATNFSNEQDCGETWYLVNTQLPNNINKSAENFIPANRFDFLKTNYIKATLKLTYSYVHPLGGDSYDNWFIEFLQANTVKFTLMNNDLGIYVIDNSNDLQLREDLLKFITDSI